MGEYGALRYRLQEAGITELRLGSKGAWGIESLNDGGHLLKAAMGPAPCSNEGAPSQQPSQQPSCAMACGRRVCSTPAPRRQQRSQILRNSASSISQTNTANDPGQFG